MTTASESKQNLFIDSRIAAVTIYVRTIVYLIHVNGKSQAFTAYVFGSYRGEMWGTSHTFIFGELLSTFGTLVDHPKLSPQSPHLKFARHGG